MDLAEREKWRLRLIKGQRENRIGTQISFD